MKKERNIRTAKITKYFLMTVLTIGYICLGSFAVFAQNSQTTSNTADKNLKSSARVNPSTRAMEFSIPLGSYPGRGGNSIPVVLNYSSKVWDMKMTSFRHEMTQAETNQYFDFIEYESTDVSPIFAEKTLAGWTSSLQPVTINEEDEIYNESGESYQLDNSNAINGICDSSLANTAGWHCWIVSTWYALTSFCPSGYAEGFETACGDNESEQPEVISIDYVCMDSPGGGGPIFNPTPIPAGSPTPVPASTPLPQIPNQVHRLRIETADGASHEFRKDDKVHNCNTDPQDCSPNYNINGTYISVDGSRMRLVKGEEFERETRDILYLPDGSRYIFPDQSPGGHYNIAEKFIDKNGNVSTYSVAKSQWTDTLGRKIGDPMLNPSFTGQPVQVKTQTYNMLGIEGQPRPYKMKWSKLDGVLESQNTRLKNMGDDNCASVLASPINADSLFQNQETLIPNQIDPIENRVKYVRRQRTCAKAAGGNASEFDSVVLDYIQLPDDRKYEFKYNEYGEITKIIYPTGSYERFVYEKANPLGFSGLEVYGQANRGVKERYVSFDGNPAHEQFWQYSDTTTTAPDGTSTETTFFGNTDAPSGTGFGFNEPRSGMVKEEKVKDANGVIRSRTINDWVNMDPRDGGAGYRDPRLKRSVTITFEPGSNAALATLNELDYDENVGDPTYFSHLNVKRKKSYHYAVISPGTTVDNEPLNWATITGWFAGKLASVTETDYFYGEQYHDQGIIGLPVETRVLDPVTNEVLSKTQFYYDDPVLESDPPAEGWEDPGTSMRGNVTYSRTLLKDPTVSSSTENWIETRAQYDNFGNLRKSWDAVGNQTETQYSSGYGYAYPTKVIAPAPDPGNSGHGTNQTSTSEMTYDFTTGLPLTVKDDSGQIMETKYEDPLLRPTSVHPINFTGPQAITEYYDTPDGDGRLSVKVKKQIDETNWDEATTFMDAAGRTLKTQAKDSQGDVFVDTLYDGMGRANCITNPHRSGETVYWNKTRFDEIGRAVESYAPAAISGTQCESSSTSGLQSLGITSSDFSTVSGSVGTVVISTDASGRKGRSITNALGQLIRVDEPTAFGGTADADLGAIGTPAQPTYYSYSPLGKMVKVAQGGQSRYFLYDNLGRLLRVKQPEQEANTGLAFSDPISGNSTWSAGFTYDIMGSVLTGTDANGTVIHNAYDNAGRVKTRSYTNEPSGINTPQVDYYYDGLGVSGANFAKGKLTKVSSSVSETRYTNFDNMGRVLSSEQATDGQTYPMSYKYNLSGALTEETYPSGEVVRNFLESDGDLSRVAMSGHTYISDFSYTSGGGVSTLKLGNGRWETNQFNERQQITQIGLGTASNDTSLWKVNYEYGEWNGTSVDATKNTGNIGKQTLTIPNTNFVQTYKYDSLYRLTEAKEKTNTSQNWIQTFGYDRFGNRTSFNQQMGSLTLNTTPSVDASTNRFNTGQGFIYDKNGNLTQDSQSSNVRSFIFNGDNKQVQVKDNNGTAIGIYYYDGEDNRIKKIAFEGTVNEERTVFVYDALGKFIAEYSNQISSTPTISYPTTDPLGSPRVITDKAGNVISRRDFMPFGEELNAGTPNRTESAKYLVNGDNLRKKFTGYQKDSETFLDYAEARYYDNNHGKFTTPDLLLSSHEPINPQTFNRYVYVGNNPVNITDPTGEKWARRTFVENGQNMVTFAWYDEKLTQEQIDQGYEAYNGRFYVSANYVWVLAKDPRDFAIVTKETIDRIGGDGTFARLGSLTADELGKFENGKVIIDSAIAMNPSYGDSTMRDMGGQISAAYGIEALRMAAAPLGRAATATETSVSSVASQAEASQDASIWPNGIQRYRRAPDATALEHIVQRHAWYSSATKVSRFFLRNSTGARIRSLVEEAYRNGTRTGNRIEYNFGRNIGRSQNGARTSRMVIHLNDAGEVRTAHPL